MPHLQESSPELSPELAPALLSKSSSKSTAQSTAHLEYEQLAQWNTTSRLLASLLSDQLLERKPVPSPLDGKTVGFLLHGKAESSQSPSSPAVWIGLSTAGLRLTEPEFLNWPVFAEDFALPVFTTTFEHAEKDTTSEFRPAVIFNHLRSALDVDPVEDALYQEVSDQLTNSAENGRYWIEWYAKREPLSFQSSVIDWEQSLYTGHPLHPMHRAFSTEDPLPKIAPENITSLNKHSISLISVPGSDVRVSGPFRKAIEPLLSQYGLSNRRPGKMIIPCLTMQIPVIKKYHPNMEVAVEDAFQFQTQSSLRTMTIPFFDYDLKVAVDAVMSSSIRCISSRTVCIINEVSTILQDLLPENLWVMGDVGGVAGSQTGDNIDDAKHIGCTIRENHSRKALANNETLVVTGALQEIPPGKDECVAAILYNLKTEQEKMDWFSEYTEGLIETFAGPVLDYGIALEPHAQNVLARINRSTGKIVGWGVRDLGSIRIHLPTIAKSGRELFSVLEHSVVPTTNEYDPWRFLRFCLFDNHLNIFMYRLGLDRVKTWAMIREKLELFFESRKHLDATKRFRDFLYSEEIQLKAFMRMKFARMARVYGYVTVPNVLLEGLKKRESKVSDKANGNGVSKETNGHQKVHQEDGSKNGSEVAFFSRT